MKVELVSFTQRNPALTAQVAAGYSDLSALFRGRGDFAENLIEYAGRVCYRSTHRMGTAPGFIVDRVREGHEDIIEHMVIVLRFVGTNQPRWFRTHNRHVEVSDLGRRGWLVSANARVWLDLLSIGAALEAASILYTLAPSVFGAYASYGKADVSGVTGIPHSLHTLTTIPALLPYENGPMRVSLLGYTQPAMIEPSIGRTHSAATFFFEGISRTCTHQLVRHRLASYSQESMRYVDMSKGEWTAIIPPSIKANPQALAEMQDFWALAEEKYQTLRAMGIRKEDARFLLPNATETRIVVTMNFASWSHFFWLRAVDKAAQWEIREMAQAALRMLYAVSPQVFFEHWKTYQGILEIEADRAV